MLTSASSADKPLPTKSYTIGQDDQTLTVCVSVSYSVMSIHRTDSTTTNTTLPSLYSEGKETNNIKISSNYWKWPREVIHNPSTTKTPVSPTSSLTGHPHPTQLDQCVCQPVLSQLVHYKLPYSRPHVVN